MSKKFDTETTPQGHVPVDRRRFLKVASTSGFTVAAMAGTAGALFSPSAVAQIQREEDERKKAAKHVMTIATAYVLGASRSYPILQRQLKENIQNATRGKVYVRLAPAGQLGAGGELPKKVQEGTIQAAQHSISNFAPFAPVVDLINLPYFCGSNQRCQCHFWTARSSGVIGEEKSPTVYGASKEESGTNAKAGACANVMYCE